MASKKGVVERLGQRKTARGGMLYSVMLDDGEWYSFGFDAPKEELEQGDMVAFTLEKNKGGYDQIVGDSLKVKKNAATGGGGTKKNYNPQTDYAAKSKYWEDKEKRDIDNQLRIRYAGAINSAVSIVDTFGVGSVGLTEAAIKKGGPDLVTDVVCKIADELYLRIGSRPFELENNAAEDTDLPAGTTDLESTENEEESEENPWGDD